MLKDNGMGPIIAIVILVVIIAGGVVVVQKYSDTKTENEFMLEDDNNSILVPALDNENVDEMIVMDKDKIDDSTMTENDNVIVTYVDSGFSPRVLEIKVGTTVTWKNQIGNWMWVASDIHPTHKILPGFDQLKSTDIREEYSYTFNKVGEWTYHNHVAPGDTGVVIVK